MTATTPSTEPVVAGFDADGNWHIPGGEGGGRFARKGTGGWSSAKALALRALRGAFARDTAKAATKMGEWNRESRSWDPDTHVPVWLEAADDYLSRLGVAKGHAVKVTYLDDTYGAIDAVHPDGTTRPVKVKWDRFADHLPSRGAFGKRTLVDDLDSDLPWHERSQTEAFIKAAFEHDLGDVYTTASVSGGVLNGEGATVNVEVYRSSDRQQIGRAWYELRVGNGVEAHIQTAMVTTKGKGIGTRFTRAIEEGLAANGVSRVTLGAMTDKRDGKRTANGAYTWARAGFGWGNYDDARKIGRMMLELDPGNDVGRRLVESKIGPDLPTPNDAATDPTGRRVLLWDHDLDNPGWSGVKHLDAVYPKAAPRVETPTVRRNTTKADKGVGSATAARIQAAGGTGQVTIADGYLARHGHPKGATATVTYVDDTYADVHPTEPGGRTIRAKWSHFADEASPPGLDAPLDPDPEADKPAPVSDLVTPQGRIDEHKAARALSTGDVSIDDLFKLGATDQTMSAIAFLVGQGHADTDNGRFGWEPLPPTLWHATTVADAVARNGLRTRGEVGGRGIGGQSPHTISLTDDRAHAEAVARGILEARAAATGDTTLDDIVRRAAVGDAGSEPFLEGPAGLIHHLRHVTGFGPDWELGDPIPDGLDTPEKRVDAWHRFAFARYRSGGPRDPFVLSGAEPLLAIDPAQVKVLRVEPANDKAMGMPLALLNKDAADSGEWRVTTGDAIRVAETFDPPTVPEPVNPVEPDIDQPVAAELDENGFPTVQWRTARWINDHFLPTDGDYLDGETEPEDIQARKYGTATKMREAINEHGWNGPPVQVWAAPRGHGVFDDGGHRHAVMLRDHPDTLMPVVIMDPGRDDPDKVEAYYKARHAAGETFADPQAPAPAIGFNPGRPTDAIVLDWVRRDGLVFPESEAMELHSAKLDWLFEEGRRRGMTDEQARAAVFAVDGAIDRSSDTLGWTRDALVEAVGRVHAGRAESDLDRGVELQMAFTDAVWQARYGDAPTIELSRIVSHDDPVRSMPGMPVDGVSSWVVRENEQQVIDWFAYRDLTPEVIRADIDRGRVLMLPWGEGRYRSNYVRIHGETLVTAAAPEGRDPREMLLDPDATAEDIADALYTGTSPGGNRVRRRSVTEQVITSGPAHDPQTRRVIRVVAALVDDDPAWVDADGNPGKHHLFSQIITIAPGADGDPHVNVYLESGGDDLWRDVERWTDTMADRIGADSLTALSPEGDIQTDLRHFIDDGWTFHRNTDAYVLRTVGDALAATFPNNDIARAWRDWDGNDATLLPQPQDVFADPDRQFRGAVLDNLTYLGIKDRTGRRAVPELLRPGAQIDWADARYLPDGTVVEIPVWNPGSLFPQPTVFTVHDGKFLPRMTGLASTAVNYDEMVAKGIAEYNGDPGRNADGRYPQTIKVVRYKAAPLPTLPTDAPDPTPGVKVPAGTTPAPPMFQPGMIVGFDRLNHLPAGTLVRQVESKDGVTVPRLADGGHDWRVQGGSLFPDYGGDGLAATPPTSGTFMVTAVPEKPNGLPDTAPPPTEFDVRARQALVDEARRLKLPKLGVTAIAPHAVGATWPTDWVAATRGEQRAFPEVKDPSKVLAAALTEWSANKYPLGAHGGETIGPLWRVPGRGMTNNVMWTDTPIEGVEPEAVALGRIAGMLSDADGHMMFGFGARPSPWREPARTPLDDAAVAERIAALRLPTQPDGNLNVRDTWASISPESDSLAWLASPNETKIRGYGMVQDAKLNGHRSLDGPVQAVRFTHNPDGKRIIERLRAPIGSPEMEVAGWDPLGDDLILSIDDPRLPEAIDNAWWENETRAGTVDRVEAGFIVDGEMHVTPGDIEPQVGRALKAQSDKLVADATNDTGEVHVSYVDGRFVLDPDGAAVPAESVNYARNTGTDTQVYLTLDGATDVVGEDGVTPDYAPVHEAWRPWEERVAALNTAREKLLAGLPGDGTRLDHLFTPPTDKIEREDAPVTAAHQALMDRSAAITEYGRGLMALWHTRSQDIESDRSRDIEYRGGSFGKNSRDRPPTITEGHAKSMTRLVRDVQKEWAAPFANDTAALVLDKLAKGEVHVERHKADKTISFSDPKASFDSVTISTKAGLVDRKRGPWVRIHFNSTGRVVAVDVHPDEAHQLDTEEYAFTSPETQAKPIGRRMMKLAQDIGLVSNADPRPTLSELAFLETMEALGHDMSTNPDLKISGASGTATLGRGTSPEVYTAKIGLNVYPRDWIDQLPEQTVEFGDDSFTTSGGGWNSQGKLVHVADPRLHPKHRDTIVHEFGHSFERAIPGLTAAEAWYLTYRILNGPRSGPPRPKFIGNVLGQDAYAFVSDFTRDYTGRVYNKESVVGNDSYEVFTTAMEQIINRGTGRRGVEDLSLTGWVLGILGLTRPKART